MFKITIHTVGAAYRDPLQDADEDTYITPMDPSRYELRRNLLEVCRKLENGYSQGCIVDINGNVTGEFVLEDD